MRLARTLAKLPAMATTPKPRTARQLILDNRLPRESRVKQAARLGIPYTSLRQYEVYNRFPPNRDMRKAFLAALSAPVQAVAKARA